MEVGPVEAKLAALIVNNQRINIGKQKEPHRRLWRRVCEPGKPSIVCFSAKINHVVSFSGIFHDVC